LRVANDDVVSFRNNNNWLIYHPNKSLIFRDVDSIWKELQPTYNGEFRNLVYGDLPKNELIAETLRRIKKRLEKIEWNVQLTEQQ
jgi:hypothetical protein